LHHDHKKIKNIQNKSTDKLHVIFNHERDLMMIELKKKKKDCLQNNLVQI